MSGQDAHFSQVAAQSQYQNPAQVMDLSIYQNRKAKIALQYRDQWRNVSNPAFRTILIEGQFQLYSSYLDNWYLGFTLLDDQSNDGIYTNNALGLNLSYSRKLSLSRNAFHQISFGSTFRYHRTNLNNSKLWFGRQYDIANLEVNMNIDNGEMSFLSQSSFLSLGLGGSWLYNFEKGSNVSASIGMMHLNGPSLGMLMDDAALSKRIVSHVSLLKKTGRFFYQGGFAQLIIQSPWQQLTTGYKIRYSLENEVSINASLAARFTKNLSSTQIESLILGFGLEANNWKAQLSYDLNLTALSEQANGTRAFELKLEYYFLNN